MNTRLVIFDLDNTLVRSWTNELLPGVAEWFAQNNNIYTAIATDQGGVGLRRWMEVGEFGNPEEKPTQADVIARLQSLELPPMPILVSWAYQNKKSGEWGPAPFDSSIRPRGVGRYIVTSWEMYWRKPYPGMLLGLMRLFQVLSSNTLMVGDMESDQLAAQAANCRFQWADEFFGRG